MAQEGERGIAWGALARLLVLASVAWIVVPATTHAQTDFRWGFSLIGGPVLAVHPDAEGAGGGLGPSFSLGVQIDDVAVLACGSFLGAGIDIGGSRRDNNGFFLLHAGLLVSVLAEDQLEMGLGFDVIPVLISELRNDSFPEHIYGSVGVGPIVHLGWIIPIDKHDPTVGGGPTIFVEATGTHTGLVQIVLGFGLAAWNTSF